MIKYLHLLVLLIGFLNISCSGYSSLSSEEGEYKSQFQNDVPISSGNLSGLHRDAGPNTPVVLIVPGSGPTDLNGNNPSGVLSNVYKQMANALAIEGISTVRVDKRGMFSSEAAGDPNEVTVDIYAQDYKNWVKTIREETGQSCVYLLGHSEGALMVSAASIDNKDVCGLILVSGLGRSFGEVLREQLKANPANKPILEQAFMAIERLEEGKKVELSTLHGALHPMFNTAVQNFLISIMEVDPAQVAAKAKKDTLIIHGLNDLQTSTMDAKILADATGGQLVLIEGINHILKTSPANRSGNFATYTKPELPISKSVIDAIRAFILQ